MGTAYNVNNIKQMQCGMKTGNQNGQNIYVNQQQNEKVIIKMS